MGLGVHQGCSVLGLSTVSSRQQREDLRDPPGQHVLFRQRAQPVGQERLMDASEPLGIGSELKEKPKVTPSPEEHLQDHMAYECFIPPQGYYMGSSVNRGWCEP